MKRETQQNIDSFYDSINHLAFHELEISILATETVSIDGWLGAALRNNLLFASEHITTENGKSLLEIINTLPISKVHPLYNELAGGFPKGFSLHLLSHQEAVSTSRLQGGESIRFSLLLIGEFSRYYIYFIKAIEWMCSNGIGNPRIPFSLHMIAERAANRSCSIWPVYCPVTPPPLQHPVRASDYTNYKFREGETEIEIDYPVPMSLSNYSHQSRTPLSRQERHNGFPGFYQLIRSIAYRILKLTALYIFPNDFCYYKQAEKQLEPFIQYAISVNLSSANIRQVHLYSTPKEGRRDRIGFFGYTGTLSFNGYFNYYIPVLLFARHIGVGNNTVYGLGGYEIKNKKQTT